MPPEFIEQSEQLEKFKIDRQYLFTGKHHVYNDSYIPMIYNFHLISINLEKNKQMLKEYFTGQGSSNEKGFLFYPKTNSFTFVNNKSVKNNDYFEPGDILVSLMDLDYEKEDYDKDDYDFFNLDDYQMNSTTESKIPDYKKIDLNKILNYITEYNISNEDFNLYFIVMRPLLWKIKINDFKTYFVDNNVGNKNIHTHFVFSYPFYKDLGILKIEKTDFTLQDDNDKPDPLDSTSLLELIKYIKNDDIVIENANTIIIDNSKSVNINLANIDLVVLRISKKNLGLEKLYKVAGEEMKQSNVLHPESYQYNSTLYTAREFKHKPNIETFPTIDNLDYIFLFIYSKLEQKLNELNPSDTNTNYMTEILNICDASVFIQYTIKNDILNMLKYLTFHNSNQTSLGESLTGALDQFDTFFNSDTKYNDFKTYLKSRPPLDDIIRKIKFAFDDDSISSYFINYVKGDAAINQTAEARNLYRMLADETEYNFSSQIMNYLSESMGTVNNAEEAKAASVRVERAGRAHEEQLVAAAAASGDAAEAQAQAYRRLLRRDLLKTNGGASARKIQKVWRKRRNSGNQPE